MEPPSREDIVARTKPKLERLLKLVEGKQTLLAQTHDFPDPDTIASALALGWLLSELRGLEATIGYGGIIGRAENKAMIKQLGIKMKRTSPKDFEKYDLVALLDTQPEVGNHCVPNTLTPDIVFDHHFPRALEGPTPTFHDVGGQYGSTSTKVTELIIAAGLEPPTDVATALFYGVKSDTQNLARDASPSDIAAYLFLLPRADNRVLNEIENPQVPLDYFRVLNKAILRAKLYDNMVVSDLGEVYTPDLCAEVADRLLQLEGVKHALAVGWYEESLFLSMRTRSRKQNAGKILHHIVAGLKLGTAGGHGPMAGARIPLEGRSQRARVDIRRKVVNRVLQAFNQDYRHFSRIVSKKDTGTAIDPPPPKLAEEARRPASKKPEARKVEPKRNGELTRPDGDGSEGTPKADEGALDAHAARNGRNGSGIRKPKPSKKKAAVAAVTELTEGDLPAGAHRVHVSARAPSPPRRRVYLDYNATAPVRPEVRRAVEPVLFGDPADGRFGNASSVHWAGQAARRLLERARARVAKRLDRKPAEIVFTSGGSEADNLALRGVLMHPQVRRPRLVTSAVEHPAVRAPAEALRAAGVDVVEVPVDHQGRLDLDRLDAALSVSTTLVSIMAVNNETGVVLPTDDVVARARAAGARIHIDAVQAAGRISLPIDADLITLSGHKLGGLAGAGVLAVRDDIPLAAQQLGGPQERGHRAGTESVAAAVALAEALDLADDGRTEENRRLGDLRDRLEAGVAALPGARIVGRGADRVAPVTTAVFSDVDGEAVLQGLDLEGIATSSGSACASGSLEPSHVLLAMGIPATDALSAVRFSLGWASVEDDVDHTLAVLPTILERARSV